MSDDRALVNQRNGRLGGPKTEAGKAVSSQNARKHGILATSLSRNERKKVGMIVARFAEQLRPAGPIEEALVEKLAVCYLRLQRCARAEQEYHRAAWMPRLPGDDYDQICPASDFRPRHFATIARLVQRYDTSLTNQFLKLLHELERQQERRGGGRVPAVAQVDVNAL